MSTTVRRAAVVTGLLLTLTLVNGCGAGRSGGEVCASGARALPSGSLAAWATYGDVLVEWSVDGERRVPPTPEEVAAGEGTITRLVTVRSDAVAWRRPSARAGLSAPATLEVANGGWTFQGSRERPYGPLEGPRLEAGQHYLAALTFADLSGAGLAASAEWITLDDFAVADGRVVAPAREGCEAAALDHAIDGKTVAEVAALVAEPPVDPAAEPYLGLDPVVRFQRASADAIATSSYTPGPGPGEKE